MSAFLRVLQIHPPIRHGVDVYRVHNLTEQIERAGHHSEVLTLAELAEAGPPSSLVCGRDIVILHRVAWDSAIEALVEAAQRSGATTVFEADDLIFVPGAGRWVDGVRRLPADQAGLYAEGLERYAATYRNCDVFLASTPFLAGLRPFGPKPSQVIGNVLGRQQLAVAGRIREERKEYRGGGRVIGFGAGTATHDRDLREVIPALRDLLSRRADLRIEIVGPVDLGSSFTDFEDRVIQREVRPWEPWWELLSGFDVALAPLERDNPYCRAKSALKFLEAAILDVPIVASHIDDYVREIDEGRTGFLAKDAGMWSGAIESLLDDADLRSGVVGRAREYVEASCTTEARAADTSRLLDAIRDRESRSLEDGERLLDMDWSIPSPFPGSGGHANIFAVARSLERRGHRSTFSVDTSQLEAQDGVGIREFVDRHFGEIGVRFRPGWDLTNERIDLAVATSWATAEIVARSDVVSKVYFVQDFENLFFPPGDDAVRAERTYRLGLSCVTLGGWLTDVLRSWYDADSSAFPFPVTVEEIEGKSAPTTEERREQRLLFFAQPGKPRRGYRLGLEALVLFHEACPEVKISFFGSKDVDRDTVQVPFEDHGILSERQLEELYRRADAALVISMTNPTLVSPNMMRCGCVPVDLDLPNNQFEYKSDEDSLLAEPTPAGIAEALRRLFTDGALLESLRKAGPPSVAGRSMEDSVDAIEAAFVRKVLTGETAERPFQLEVFQGEPTTWVSLGDGPVAQAIRGRGDGLTRISLMLGTFEQVPGAMCVELADGRTGEILMEQLVPGETLCNNQWNHIDFEAIADSSAHDFDLRLRMSETDAAPVAVYLSGVVAGLDGNARMGARALAAAICFQTHVRPACAPAAPISNEKTSPGHDVRPNPTSSDGLSQQAARIVELIQARGSRGRELRGVLEERTTALELSAAGVAGFLNRIEARVTRPPFDRLLRIVHLAPPRETYLEPARFVTADLRGNVVVAQRFLAGHDGLDRLMVRIATEGLRLMAPIVIRLREGGPRGPVVREVEIEPNRVQDNQYCTVLFEALSDSEGQTYCFELSSPSAVRGCAPRVWGHRKRGASGQRRYHCGARSSGRLDFLVGFGTILDPGQS